MNLRPMVDENHLIRILFSVVGDFQGVLVFCISLNEFDHTNLPLAFNPNYPHNKWLFNILNHSHSHPRSSLPLPASGLVVIDVHLSHSH